MIRDIRFSKELMDVLGACERAEDFLSPNNLWDAPEDIVVTALKEQRKIEELLWWKDVKNSPEFVHYYGKEITVISYKVFNPLEGTHASYATKREADEAFVIIAKKIVDFYSPAIMRAIKNEFGDEAWEPVPEPTNLIISLPVENVSV